MKIRLRTLWRVPVFCTAASGVSFYLTVYLGRYFFVVQTVRADGVTAVSADPLRSAIFHAAVFLLVLLVGGLWAFRSMTRAEIAVSAALLSAVYLAILLMQLYLPNFPVSLSVRLATVQNWIATLDALLFQLTGRFKLSALLAALAPFLFVPFGRKAAQ